MLLSFENVTFGYNGVPNLRNVNFSFHENERVGLLGGNGEGKTTLLKLIIGELSPDEGKIFLKNGIRIGYLEQTGGFISDLTVYGAMKEIFAEDERLIQRLREAEKEFSNAEEAQRKSIAERIDHINKKIAARDSYSADIRIKTVLNGMGFSSVFDQLVSTMSGGEKTRLKLCKLLLEEPDLLILDEPTNHLDLKTLFFLEDYLSSFKGALLIVSHDRYFLDKLTLRTLELENGRLISYKGNYSKYKILKEEAYKTQMREWEKQQEEISKLKAYVDKNLVRATTAKSALSRVNQLERMEILEKPATPSKPPQFTFQFQNQPYETILKATCFDLFAGDKLLLKNASFTLNRGEKCAITGENGTGKTTLLKFLMKESNQVSHGKFVKIGYYDQENADLDPNERVLDAFWGKFSSLSQTEARKILAKAGLCAADIDKKCGELSGGQKAKLELSLLEAKGGNVLFLDEPTNHLDLAARESLEESLRAFDGTVLFVSHDRRFMEAIANRVIFLSDQSLMSFSCGYQAFLEAQRTLSVPGSIRKETSKPISHGSYRSKEERAEETKRKLRVTEIEKTLETLETEEESLNAQLIHFGADYRKVKEISERLAELHRQSEELYREYETLI